MWYERLVKPLQVGERVSDKNTGVDISKWIQKIVTDSRAVTKGFFGVTTSICPDLVTFDCAIELLYGALHGFRSKDHQVDNSQIYANCVMLILLSHEKLLVTNCGDRKSLSVLSYRKLLNICIFASKQCDSHVYRAITQHIKNTPKRKRSVPMVMYQDNYELILRHMSTEILKLRSLVDVFVRLGVIMKIVTTYPKNLA